MWPFFLLFLEGLTSKFSKRQPKLIVSSPPNCVEGIGVTTYEEVYDHQRKRIPPGVWVLLIEEVPWCDLNDLFEPCNP